MNCARLNHPVATALNPRRAALPALQAHSQVQLLAATARRWGTNRAKGDGYNKSNKSSSHPRTSIQRTLNPDVTKFLDVRTGQLSTTPAFARFFRDHPTVEFDHGKMTRLDARDARDPSIRALTAVAKQYGVRLAWSPLHVIHPHHLGFFTPRGHPVASKIRSDYARRDREEALWTFGTLLCAPARAVVRFRAKRALVGAVHRGLRDLGYKSGRREADGKEVHGTLWLAVTDPLRAAEGSPKEFGRVVAEALDKLYAARPGDVSAPGRSHSVPPRDRNDGRPKEQRQRDAPRSNRPRRSADDSRRTKSDQRSSNDPFAVLQNTRK